jgi:lipopolysaccharide transport system permease protein
LTDPNPAAANQTTVDGLVRRAIRDLVPIFVRNRTWRDLASVDIRSKYRRTFLGPWWITASHGIFALTIGAVSGNFLGADMRTYLPYFITGITMWNFVSSTVNESCGILVGSSGLIKATNLPIGFHVMRMVQRNFIIFLHNTAIIPLVWFVYPWALGPSALFSIAGVAAIYVVTASVSLIVAVVCSRYRDVPPVVGAVLQILFFVSPIIWTPEQLHRGHIILALNPVTHLLAVTRDPLLGRPIAAESWIVVALTTAFVLGAAALIYARYRSRVVFWV